MSTEEQTDTPILGVAGRILTPTVSVGFTTILGTILTIVGAIGTAIAAAKSNDFATVAAAVTTITTAVTTLGGRFAQAVALIRNASATYGPMAAAVIDGLDDPEVDAATEADLPSDVEEFATAVPDVPNEDLPAPTTPPA